MINRFAFRCLRKDECRRIVFSLVWFVEQFYFVTVLGTFASTLKWEPAAFFRKSDVDPAD